MAKGLRLQGARYNIIVLVFFIPYIIFQAVATVLTRKVGPRNFMTAIVILWGSCVIVGHPSTVSIWSLILVRALVSSSHGIKWSASESYWAFLKLVTSPAVCTFCHAGTQDLSCRNVLRCSTLLGAWLLRLEEYYPMASCK